MVVVGDLCGPSKSHILDPIRGVVMVLNVQRAWHSQCNSSEWTLQTWTDWSKHSPLPNGHLISAIFFFCRSKEDQMDHIYVPQLPLASSVNNTDEQIINHLPNHRQLPCCFLRFVIAINKWWNVSKLVLKNFWTPIC